MNEPLPDIGNPLRQLADMKFALDEASIVAITDNKGVIRYVNDKFCEISGFSREELIGRDHRVVNSAYHSKAFMRELWQTIKAGKVWRGEIRNQAKGGHYYWVDTTIVPILDDDGKPYQFLAIRHEITQLKSTEKELQTMMAHMMQIQEEERKRFSRDLHDGIGQSLFSLKIKLDRIMSEDGNPALTALGHDVAQLMADVRGLAWELRPSVLDDLGIVPAVRTYIDSFSRYYGIRVKFVSNLSRRPPLQAETAIYRVIQEALTNVGKYAGVDEASVTLQDDGTAVEAIVHDEGSGFVRRQRHAGVGLFSMEERARAVSGELTVVSEPGKGTTVRLKIPYNI